MSEREKCYLVRELHHTNTKRHSLARTQESDSGFTSLFFLILTSKTTLNQDFNFSYGNFLSERKVEKKIKILFFCCFIAHNHRISME